MPVGIASGNTTVFHYQGNTTPPSSWSQWGMVRTMRATHQHTHDPSRSLLLSCSLALLLSCLLQVIQGLVQHLVERYGYEEVRQWPFEVWNEPNCGFWTGTQADYFTLYQVRSFARSLARVSLSLQQRS